MEYRQKEWFNIFVIVYRNLQVLCVNKIESRLLLRMFAFNNVFKTRSLSFGAFDTFNHQICVISILENSKLSLENFKSTSKKFKKKTKINRN